MNINETYNLLLSYLNGELSENDENSIKQLIEHDSYWKQEYEIAKAINKKIEALTHQKIEAKTDENWIELHHKIQKPAKQISRNFWTIYTKYAAAALVIIMAGWYFMKPSPSEFYTFEPGKAYNSNSTDILKIKLNDGSLIVLDKNSSLIIDKHYNNTNRLVKVSGTAYFEVSKNAIKPFIVESHQTFTKVLGTRFEIKEVSNQNLIISLFNGKIKFKANRFDKLLETGERLEYSIKNKTLKKEVIHSAEKPSYAIGIMLFKDESLLKIAKSLENKFEIQLQIPVNISNTTFTASFDGLDLDQSLALLSELTDSKIIKKGEVFILKP